MNERKMNEMAKYYEKEETMHPGLAVGLIVLYETEDELVHQVQPDGSISWCRDASCPCRDQDEQYRLDPEISPNSIPSDCEPYEEEEQDPEDDMEQRLARQAAQHLEDRGYFDMWGCHEDDEPWYLSRPNQSDWLVE